MSLNKNLFDAALMAGVRDLLSISNQNLRNAESDTFALLLDSNGKFLSGASVLRNCPMCGASFDLGVPVLSAHGMNIIRCSVCQLIYSREVINSFFENERYTTSAASVANVELKNNSAYATLEREKAKYVIARLVEHAGNKGTLLDIGSSTGTLLTAANENTWNAYGIEINGNAQKVSQQKGHAVICDEFPCELPENWNKIDAIALFDVLEHIIEPLDFLAKLSKHIPIGGWLMIQVPNYRSLLLTIEGVSNNNICHGHWSYFEANSLHKMLRKAGFEVKFFETYITELDRVFNYTDNQIYEAWYKLTGLKLNNPRGLTVEQIHEFFLGYKLFGLFQKVSE